MAVPQERRASGRIDKIFGVRVYSEEAGEQRLVARNISDNGMFVEMADPLPLRTKVLVRFVIGDDECTLCAVARVQNHYYLHYADQGGLRALCGVGLRFLRFLPEVGESMPRERLH